MRLSRVGRVLLTLGALIGVAASVGLVIGFEPARLPAALLNVAAYKLTFLAAFGLFAGGAIVLRHAKRETARNQATGASAPEIQSLAAGNSNDGALGASRPAEWVGVTPAKEKRASEPDR